MRKALNRAISINLSQTQIAAAKTSTPYGRTKQSHVHECVPNIALKMQNRYDKYIKKEIKTYTKTQNYAFEFLAPIDIKKILFLL